MMKKVLYIIALCFIAISGKSQGNLVFSWEGMLFTTPNPDVDSVYLYVQNPSGTDEYLLGWNVRMYYNTDDILIAGETGGLNPSFTLSSTALGNGYAPVTPQHVDIPDLTMLGHVYDRFVSVGIGIAAGNPGLLVAAGTGLGGDPDGEAPAVVPIKLGTFRFRVQQNNGGFGCTITPPFEASQNYTGSLGPVWDPDLEEQIPIQPPPGCSPSGGCPMEFLGQLNIPEQGNVCCAACGPLNASPLPVKLLRFVARKHQSTNTSILWHTASEENVSHFEIERSRDAVNWELVRKANAHGNSQSIHGYTLIDYNVYDGRSSKALFYYRLKIVDNDGSFEYSNIETVVFGNSASAFSAYIFPNPSSDDVTVQFSYGENSPEVRNLLIYNNLGQIVFSQEVAQGAGSVYLDHATTGLTAGSYVLELRDADDNPLSQDKIVVQK